MPGIEDKNSYQIENLREKNIPIYLIPLNSGDIQEYLDNFFKFGKNK